MSIILREKRIRFSPLGGHIGLLEHFGRSCDRRFPNDTIPVRFVVAQSGPSGYKCEIGVIGGDLASVGYPKDSVFTLRRRVVDNSSRFTAVLLIPTGIGAAIGGHAGDAGPVARMLAEVCDSVVLHPNVVNASDINEMPNNAMYVEGSVITRLLMGTIGLQPVRANRVLVVMDAHSDDLFTNAAVNAVNAARATYGLACPDIVLLTSPVKMRAEFTKAGRAAGTVRQLEDLCTLLSDRSGQYDAVALSSIVDVPFEFHQRYFDAGGGMVNPWGGVEAMLTHALSTLYDVPTAHSPMFESREVSDMDPGIVDPRMAAEAYSTTFLQCTLKGLRQSPRIVTDPAAMTRSDVLTADDVSCVVIPDGCLGVPTLAALEQEIPVIAVKENHNLMKNHLSDLPWATGRFVQVANYWEAAGVIAAMRAGIDPGSVRRPVPPAVVSRYPPSSAQEKVRGPEGLVATTGRR